MDASVRLARQPPGGVGGGAANGGQGRDGCVRVVPPFHGQASQGQQSRRQTVSTDSVFTLFLFWKSAFCYPFVKIEKTPQLRDRELAETRVSYLTTCRLMLQSRSLRDVRVRATGGSCVSGLQVNPRFLLE